MSFIQFIFYAFSTVAVASAVMVIISRNTVYGALFLVLTFFAMSGIWMLLEAEFLALILVLVYVGAVMTLFLFVVMMLRINVTSVREGFVKYFPFAVLIMFMVIGISIIAIGPSHFGLGVIPHPPLKPADFSNTTDLGLVLYTDYAYPFEIAAIMLLAAIVAAIGLTHRKPLTRKVQNTEEQVAVKRSDRVKLISMPSEKRITTVNPGVPPT